MVTKNFHKKPVVWDKVYSSTNKNEVIDALDYGFKNPEIFKVYYSWLEVLIRNKIKFKRSLEVGSGTGSYSLILKKLGIVEEVYLLDYSKESLKIAEENFRRYGEKGHFILGDAFKLPFKDNFFDLTISGGLLEHFSEEDAVKILQEKRRVSKYILSQVPINTLAYWILRMIVTVRKLGWPFGYEKPMNRKQLERIYAQTGIKVIDEQYHDILTSIKFWIDHRIKKKLNFKKNKINKLFANEIAILGRKLS